MVALAAAAAAGCFPAIDDLAGGTQADSRSDGTERPERRRRGATWIVVRVWAEQIELGARAASDRALKVECPGEDVAAAGLCVTAAEPPERGHETLLLRARQSGFAALARAQSAERFEIADRPLGGPDEPLDLGFEVVCEAAPNGRIALELAPLFRTGAGSAAEEFRAHALACSLTLDRGATVALESAPNAPSAVVRSLFADAGGARRRLLLQVDVPE
jgi:hypothetical protein